MPSQASSVMRTRVAQVALPTWRMGVAFAYSELGRGGEARRELDQAAEPDLIAARSTRSQYIQ